MLLHKQQRWTGLFIALLGIPVGWARIYIGVHFPLDIIGAAVVGLVSAGLIRHLEHRLKPRDGAVK